jgi:hypothetical protein
MSQLDEVTFAALLRESCENVRHVRNERIWFGNIYVAAAAAGLALLPREAFGASDGLPGILLLTFLTVFSSVAWFSSLRLVAELEEALNRLAALTERQGVSQYVSLGVSHRVVGARMKLRWVFPLFYGLTTLGFLTVLIARLAGAMMRTGGS